MNANDSLKGRSALVTGASRGVGKALALDLARAGCRVAVNYRKSRGQAEEVLASVRAIGVESILVQADTAEDAECRGMVDRIRNEWGCLDILVNNAATTQFIPHKDMESVSTACWDRIFAVNVRGVFQCVRAARSLLEASGGGQVVNIASIAGLYANGSSIPYCASKAALINMTQSLARALAPKVRVNAVAPGFIESQWTIDGLGDQYEATRLSKSEQAPLESNCLPQDVSDAVMSLLTGSRMVTGHTLVCDAGALIGKG